uniref:Pro-neuregulin-1, membrane-bound isoform n=1 Tax=Esox lucius TaxID=8010 RepID=A0AAY5JX53_ESOLU
MTEGVEAEESSAELFAHPGSVSPTRSCADPGRAPKEALAEPVAGGEGGDEDPEGGGDHGDGGRAGPPGLLGLAGTCCVCVGTEPVLRCLRSEKICIVPILACLLSLALCTAGLKWVFVDKIFEYEPPTHLDPDRMEQNPFLVIADPTKDLPLLLPHPSSPTLVTPMTTTGQHSPGSPVVTQYSPTSALTYRTNPPTKPGNPTTPKPVGKATSTPYPKTTVESNDIIVPRFPATSTTPAVKTSSHVTRCSDSEKNYCVNGGDCFTLEVMPGQPKLLCRCLKGYTGNRCQTTIPVRVISLEEQAEEVYQKRVLTITGICIALLVVGIMCLVAYCKTKKQRKKLHDRLRQSLRNERNTMAGVANGPLMSNPPLENIQLVNQFPSKSAPPAEHVIEKETETSFSMNQYTSSTQQSTTLTQTSSQSWSNGRSESALLDGRSILMMSSAESRQHATPSQRGRLNATGGARDLSAHQKSSRDTPDSCRDSPYNDRYVSAVTTPTHLSPVELLTPVTPGSPPSEMSASLATPAPSLAVSPSGEEERPLLFTASIWPRDKPRHDPRHAQSKRNSAHYNHGQDVHSPPPSPLRIVEDDDYETTQEYEAVAAELVPPNPPQSLPKKLTNSNNNNGRLAKRTKVNGHAAGHTVETRDRGNSTERGGSESETEEERVGEDTPFLSLQNPLAAGVAPITDSSRTNPALRLSPHDDLQARLSSVIANQDPIAV